MLNAYANVLVLVTGGAGFIGSHVAEQLVHHGAQVRVLDNLSTGHRENLDHIKDHVEFIEGDITNYDDCLKATEGVKVIFHLAAQVSVPGSVENPIHCYKTNIDGTVNLLEAARSNGVKRIVFSSSSAIYGAQAGAFKEDETAPKPESPYGMSKLMGEMLMNQWYDLYGLEAVSMRYFNVFGPRQDPNSQYAAVVAKFTDCMKQNLPVTFYGDGKQTRDYVPVEYVAQANLALGVLPKSSVCGNVYNIATGKTMDLFELFEKIKKDFPYYKAEIQFKPPRPGDVKHTCADCSKYQEVIKEVQL